MITPEQGHIKEILQSLLRRCELPFEFKPLDQELYQHCIEEAVRRGYPVDGHLPLRAYFREGVYFTSTCYGHLDRKDIRVWIALLTSCAFAIDDTVTGSDADIENACQFSNRFNRGQEQGNKLLVATADLLREAQQHFHALASNLITTSFLNYINGNLLEIETEDMQVARDAYEYPTFSRTLSGLAQAVAFFIFPREIPLKEYIQAIPEIASFTDGMNDTFSFYKEDKASETTTRILLIAARDNVAKLDALDALAEMTVTHHLRAQKILEGSPAACEMYKQYAAGLAAFYASLVRYELADLQL